MKRSAIRFRERDRELVRDLFLHRILRRDDIIRLGHFRSVARCNHRLSQLVAAGVLRKLANVNGLTGHQALYALGVTAPAILAAHSDYPLEEVRRTGADREGPILIEHALRVLDFRHRLHEECSARGIEVAEWLCEMECLHEFEFRTNPYASWKKVVVKPDASFSIEMARCPARFFFEADLGHVSLPRFAQKLRRYERYLLSGAYGEAYGTRRFAVLTITVGERRLAHLAALPCSGFNHLLTTWSRIEANGIFNGAWTTPQHPDVRLVDVFDSDSEGARR